jgi:putative (di)nucleoside polyphosphate hydrolase
MSISVEKHKLDTRPYRPCVGIMLFNNDGHVFLGRRNDITHKSWQMPQGGINLNENPKTAALRELEEETGIKSVTIIDQMPQWLSYDYPLEVAKKSFSNHYCGQRQLWFAMRFIGSDDEINLYATHAEFSEWKWSKLECITSLIVDFKKPIYKVLVKQFKHLAIHTTS